MPVGIPAQGAAVAGVPDPVGIGLSGGQETGMKIRGNFPAFCDADIRREHGVQHKGILFRRNAAVCIEMNLLVQRVDAGIRSG